MYLKRDKRKKDTYYSIVESYREDGKVKKRILKNLGSKKKLDKKYGNAEAYAQSILEKMKAEAYTENFRNKVKIELNQDVDQVFNKNAGYTIINAVYSMLEIDRFFYNKTTRMSLPFSLNKVAKLLIINNFISPGSIKHLYDNKDYLFGQFDFSLDQTYDALDYLSRFSVDLQSYLNKTVENVIGLDLSLGKYDVTNCYWCIDFNDPDILDKDGNIIQKGLRHKGPSKEHSPNPITQIGVMCDRYGIPLSFNVFSGGESEKLTLLEAVDRTQKAMGIDRIIVVADRGINTSSNMYGLARDNGAYDGRKRRTNDDDIEFTEKPNGFIFGEKIRGGGKDFTDWVLNEGEYSDQKYERDIIGRDEKGNPIFFYHKSRIIEKTIYVRLKNSNKKTQRKILLKQMVYFSEKYARRSQLKREEVLEKSKQLVENKADYDALLKKGPGVYVSSENYAKSDGKVVPADVQYRNLNEEKIKADQKLDGFYCLVTSELDMPDYDIWKNYSELHEIEDNFRISKSEFKLRPMFLQLRDHIQAKVLICYIDLLIHRILRALCNNKFSTGEIDTAIRNYRFNYSGDGYFTLNERYEVIDFFSELFNLEISPRHFISQAEINKILHKKFDPQKFCKK